jgi:hypothetical protein
MAPTRIPGEPEEPKEPEEDGRRKKEEGYIYNRY